MKPYLDLLRNIMENGHDHPDRTGAGRRSIFATQTRFKMADGFPFDGTRELNVEALVHEMLWFISGDTDSRNLEKAGVKIWKKWAVSRADIDAFVEKHKADFYQISGIPVGEPLTPLADELAGLYEGKIGPMYGHMWRNAPQIDFHLFRPAIKIDDIPKRKLEFLRESYEQQPPEFKSNATFADFASMEYFRTVDQLNDLVINLKNDPYSARHVVSAWIPSTVPVNGIGPQENVLLGLGSLAPCHALFQCFVSPAATEGGKKRLSLQMYQRSVDTPLGAPYNIAQYSLLLHMLAQVTDMEADEFIWVTGDTHIYLNQLDSVKEQLAREPSPLPKLWLNPEVKDLFDFTANDIRIEGYEPQGVIRHAINV